jgi:hypothetical protein
MIILPRQARDKKKSGKLIEKEIHRFCREFVQDGESSSAESGVAPPAPVAAAAAVGLPGNSLQGATLVAPLMAGGGGGQPIGGSSSGGGGFEKGLVVDKTNQKAGAAAADGGGGGGGVCGFLYQTLLCWDMGGNFRTGARQLLVSVDENRSFAKTGSGHTKGAFQTNDDARRFVLFCFVLFCFVLFCSQASARRTEGCRRCASSMVRRHNDVIID